MKVKDKEKLNNPLKGWQILSAISSMVFHTVIGGCHLLLLLGCSLEELEQESPGSHGPAPPPDDRGVIAHVHLCAPGHLRVGGHANLGENRRREGNYCYVCPGKCV